MLNDKLHNAILNNVEWCERIANSHKVSSERTEISWRTTGHMPPYYPNIISMKAGIGVKEVSDLVDGLPIECGVKDSYADLDLAEFGFSIKFDAHWCALSKSRSKFVSSESSGSVSSTEKFEEWIAAWAESPADKSIFKPEVVSADIQFLYHQAAGRISSGLIVNQSANVAGITNTFGNPAGIAECINYACQISNGRPLVSYGAGNELSDLQYMGFEVLGELRVWVR